MAKKKTRRPARRKARPAAKKRVEAVPRRYGAVTAHLVIRDCARAIEFYGKAFGARASTTMPGPDGKVMHAELRFGDRIVMMGEEDPARGGTSPQTLGGTASSVMLYVRDCDRTYAQAVAAGAAATMPLQDMFWGDRYGVVTDPFGHKWAIATHKVDLSPKQMAAAAQAAMAQPPGGAPPAQP